MKSGDRLDVLVLAPYPQGTVPGQRYRFEQFADRLRADGIWLEVSSFLSEDIMPLLHQPRHYRAKLRAVLAGAARRLCDVRRARRYDLVLVYREATPIGYPVIERLLTSAGVPYLLDFDDAIYLPNASDANRALGRLKFTRKTALIARHAALVTAGNKELADWARGKTEHVRVIPTTIDTDLYRPRTAGGDRSPVCIGWSGSVTTSPYLDALAPTLRRLQRDFGVRLLVIGDPGYRIDGAEVDAISWCEKSEVADLQRIDIGIMPLPDDRWARGKCGLKALQYMALAIPTVMSPVGVNVRIAEGGAARLAGSNDQWYQALSDLIVRPDARRELGERGRERVELTYSTNVVAPLWADALKFAAAR